MSIIETTNFGYPAGTAGAERDGYFHRLSEAQEIALSTVQRWVVDNEINMSILSSFALHPVLTLLRYLRGNSFDPEKTIEHIKRSCKWRKSMGMDELIVADPELVLGFPMSDFMSNFPHFHAGYDLSGRPVMYKQYSLIDATTLMRKTDLEQLLKYHVWEQEVCMRLCKEQSLKTGYIVETTTTILDLKDMRLAQVNKDFLAFVKAIAAVDSKYYPETLGKMFVINAPSAFPFVWRMVKLWLDADVASKIQVMSGPREWLPVLSECIGLENIPSNYGGKAKPLDVSAHPYEEAMSLIKNSENSRQPTTLTGVGLGSTSSEAGVASSTFRMPSVSNGVEPTMLRRTLSMSRDEEEVGSYQSLSDHHFCDAKEAASQNSSSNPHALHSMPQIPETTLQSVEWDEELAYLRTLQTPSSRSLQEDSASTRVNQAGATGMLSRLLSVDPLWIFDFALSQFSPSQLRRYLGSSLKLHMCMAIGLLILAAYSITTTRWVSAIAQLQMWTGIVVLLVSTAMITMNFAGFLGWWYQNKPLLFMYGACQSVAAVVYLSISLASLLYATSPEISSYSKAAIVSAISNEKNRLEAENLLHTYNVFLGVSSFIAFVFTLVPTGLSFAYSRRFGYQIGTHNRQHQLRIVLKVCQGISVVAALCMIIYGGRCLDYLFAIAFDSTVFPIFGLVYGGVAILICASLGVWVSETSRPEVVSLYYKLCQPLLIVILFVVAAVSLGAIPGLGVAVNSQFSQLLVPHSDTSEDELALAIQTQLLVAGILSIFVCLFQITSLITAYKIWRLMPDRRDAAKEAGGKKESGGRRICFNLRNFNDVTKALRGIYRDPAYQQSACCFWGALMGIFNIFFNGTYAILGGHFAKAKNSQNVWATAAWRAFSRADERYQLGDSFLVCSNALNALVTGPLLLVYAWATYVKAPFRHVSGIVACLLMLYQEVAFYSMSINDGLGNFHRDSPESLSAVIIPGVVFLVVFPVLVLHREVLASSASTSRSDTLELIVGIDLDSSVEGRGSTAWGGSQANGETTSITSSIVLSHRGQTSRVTPPDSRHNTTRGARSLSLGAAISLHEGSVLGAPLRKHFFSRGTRESTGSSTDKTDTTRVRGRSSSSFAMNI